MVPWAGKQYQGPCGFSPNGTYIVYKVLSPLALVQASKVWQWEGTQVLPSRSSQSEEEIIHYDSSKQGGLSLCSQAGSLPEKVQKVPEFRKGPSDGGDENRVAKFTE